MGEIKGHVLWRCGKSTWGPSWKSREPRKLAARVVAPVAAPVRNVLGWAPAFVTGFGAGALGMVAVALLLYSGEGLLRSLAVIVATEFGAFGLGMGMGMGGSPDQWDRALESLRRRWLLVLVTFGAAAGFTLLWDVYAGFGASGMTQTLGLALLAGLPLYACGRLLGGINAVRRIAGLTGDGVWASLGAAAGVLVTGLGALPRVGVFSFVLFLIVMLSGTARFQGWVLRPIKESIGAVEVAESDPSEGLGSEVLSSEVLDSEPPSSEALDSEALNAAGPETP